MTVKPKAKTAEPTQAELNLALKKIQLKRNEMELAVRQDELVLRSVFLARMLKNGAQFKSIFMALPSRIRQELHLTLDQQSAMDRVIDAVMAETLKRNEMELEEGQEEQSIKAKRIRRKTAL
jgi:hypothetical protein